MIRKYLILSLLLVLTACTGGVGGDRFESRPLQFSELKGWEQEDHLQAVEVFKKSCPVFAKRPRKETSGSGIEISASTWNSLCREAESATNNATAKEFFEKKFTPYRIANNGKEKGLFTGYYEPVLYGSLTKKGNYKYPIYAVPSDLANNKPYLTRAEIDDGKLVGRAKEIVWVDDPVMLFFMQIQGSGRVRLAGGQELRIGYGDQNGQQYVSLGKIMEDEGYLPKGGTNFFTIREWLYQHPQQATAVMQRNPSYVFFKQLNKPEVVGSIGTPLTPQRSIAIDNKYIPYGLPVYIETELPIKTSTGQGVKTFNQIMVAQDTGGAIRSPVRADIFFGAGEEAEYLAGYMKGRGVYNLLVPKENTSQLQ